MPFELIREKVSSWIDDKKTMPMNTEPIYEIDRDLGEIGFVVANMPIHKFMLFDLYSNENVIKASTPI